MAKARGGILAGISLALVALLYGAAWRFDLQCDDLLVIRPWSRAELFAVWHGTWEPTHAFAVFFRPIATWFYAGTFELFGLNASAHMLLSLAMLALVTWLLAMFVARESGSIVAGVMAAGIYAAHPNTPWATGVWITNDFHKLTAISALCALLLWQRTRHRQAWQWLLVAPFAVACFLIKEDGLMLIPALLSLQWARAYLVGDVKRPGAPVIATGVALGAALVLWRWLALRELGGFALPDSFLKVFHNATRGPLYAFTLHGSLSVLTLAEKATALAVAGAVAIGIAVMPRERRFLPAAGVILMFWYDLPLALISNVMRYYMLTIGSVMVLVPVFRALGSVAPGTWPRIGLRLAALAFVAVHVGDQQRSLAVFAPCQRLARECVAWNLEENPTLPPEGRAYVASTVTACAVAPDTRPRIGDAGTLTWGLGATSVDTTTGARSSDVTGPVTQLIRGDASAAIFTVRHPQAGAARPIRVEIVADGRRFSRDLTTPAWTTIDVPLANGVRAWLRGAHRVDATFSRPGAEWK